MDDGGESNGDNLRDASFSYLREESSVQKSRNKKKSDQEGEISVFGAERYFNMPLEDGNISNSKIIDRRSSSIKKENYLDHHQQQQHHHHHEQSSERPRLAPSTPSASSEVSWTSRSTAMLLRNSSQHHNNNINKKKKKMNTKMKKINSYGKNIFATIGSCTGCSDEKSVYVDHDRGKLEKNRDPKSDHHAHDHHHHGHLHLDPTFEISSKRSEDQFAFPILSSTTTNTTTSTTTTTAKDNNKIIDLEDELGRMSLEVFGSKTAGVDHHDDVATNLERKLSVLTWDAIPVTPGHNIINKQISSMYNDDNNNLDSDASSDLFEIENITAASRSPEHQPPPPSVLLFKASRQLLVSNDNMSRHTTPNYGNTNATTTTANVSSQYCSYEPSEASIEWSVVTASAAADQMSSAASVFDEKKLAATANSITTAGGGVKYNKAGRVDKKEVRSRGGVLGCKSHKAVRVAETAQTNVRSNKDEIIKVNQMVDNIIRPQ